MKTCILCGLPFEGWGNNPEPVARFEDGKCCDRCNGTVVVPARIGRLEMNMQPRDTSGDPIVAKIVEKMYGEEEEEE